MPHPDEIHVSVDDDFGLAPVPTQFSITNVSIPGLSSYTVSAPAPTPTPPNTSSSVPMSVPPEWHHNLPDDMELCGPPFSEAYLEKYFYSQNEPPTNPSWGRYYWVNSGHPGLEGNGGYWQCIPNPNTNAWQIFQSHGGWRRLRGDDWFDSNIQGTPAGFPSPVATPTKPLNKWWNSKEKSIVMLRGLPSSGKSTLAYLIWMGLRSECGSRYPCTRVDADSFAFNPTTGKANSQEEIYTQLQAGVEHALHEDFGVVVVAAPFFSKLEVNYYKQLAKKTNRKFLEVVAKGEFAKPIELKSLKGRFEL